MISRPPRLSPHSILFLLGAFLAAEGMAHAQLGNRTHDGRTAVRSDPRVRPADYPAARPAAERPPEVEAMNRSAAKAALKVAADALKADPPNYTEAEYHYLLAIDLRPTELSAYLGLGKVYVAKQLYRDAAWAYARAVKIKPKSAEARHGLGLAYHMQGDKDAALEQYRALEKLDKVLANALAEKLKEPGRQ